MPRLVILLPFLLAADWPQHLGPTRDGHSPETQLLRQWPKDGPKQLWNIGVGSGWSGPVVADGKVLLHHRVGDNEVLQCWNAADGKEIWKYSVATGYTDDFQFDDGPRAAPTIAENFAFTLGADGKLSCVGLENGKRVWDRDLSVDYPFKKGYFGMATSPLVDDDRVYVNVGAKGAGVVAFDRKTGTEAWKASNDEASYSSPVLATLAGKRQLVCFTRAGLLVLDPTNGTKIHAMPFRARIQASVNAATPLVSDNRVFLTASYNTGAILLEAAKDGWKQIWKNDDSLSCHYNTPVKVGEFLYGVHGRQEAGPELRCVEWATGKVRWAKDGFGCASLIAADGLLIAAAESGELVLIEPNADEYREKSRFTAMTKPIRAPAALSDGRLFVRDGKKLAVWQVK